MPITRLSTLLAHARAHGYAIGYFEAWDQYSLEAMAAAAEENNSPAILGFGGAVTRGDWLESGGIENLAGLARGLAERCRVPAAVLFNEAQNLEQVRRGLAAGCNAVMLDSSHLTWDDNLAATQAVVALARAAGAEVEAELGHLPTATPAKPHDPAGPGSPLSPHFSSAAHLTDPEQAGRFVAETGIDVLGVAIGNVHLLSDGQAALDLDLLARIHRAAPVPLTLHGGSGLPPAALPAAIQSGVAKINYGTRLKQYFLAGVQEALAGLPQPMNVHDYIGSRAATDILVAGQARLRPLLAELMALYGSAGQAGSFPVVN
jgi:ketose-bisphosphate aldolase